MTDRQHHVGGELEHLLHRERDLVARLELAKERLAFFPNGVTERHVASLGAEHDDLVEQLNSLVRALRES